MFFEAIILKEIVSIYKNVDDYILLVGMALHDIADSSHRTKVREVPY